MDWAAEPVRSSPAAGGPWRGMAVLPAIVILAAAVLVSLPTASFDARAGEPTVEAGAAIARLPEDTLRVGILPAEIALDPGDEFEVEITILTDGPPAFNAYDAVVAYDPEKLTFLQRSQAEQEGPLMTEACPNRFHIFTIGPDSLTLTVNHALLCAGVTVMGPGVVYRLLFRCNEIEGATELRLLTGPAQTRFFNNGLVVTPLVTESAQVIIGEVSAAESRPPTVRLALDAAPNPFNPRTVFTFELPERRRMTLRVYGADGRLVRSVAQGTFARGRHDFDWDGRDRYGRVVPSGIYFVRLEARDFWGIRSLTLVR